MAVMGTGAPNISGEHVPNSVLKFIDEKMCCNVIHVILFYILTMCVL